MHTCRKRVHLRGYSQHRVGIKARTNKTPKLCVQTCQVKRKETLSLLKEEPVTMISQPDYSVRTDHSSVGRVDQTIEDINLLPRTMNCILPICDILQPL